MLISRLSKESLIPVVGYTGNSAQKGHYYQLKRSNCSLFLSPELLSYDLNTRPRENTFERAIKPFFGVWGLVHCEARRHELMFFISFCEPE